MSVSSGTNTDGVDTAQVDCQSTIATGRDAHESFV